MPSHVSAPIFAAALTRVVQWLDFKTFGRASWYDRATILLREASDAAPSLDDMKLAEARMEVRAALQSRTLTAHPPAAFLEELAMPVTLPGAAIYASELDELDTVSGGDYVALSAGVEERWAAADALWRKKATPKAAAKPNPRPRPTPTAVATAAPHVPKASVKRKGAPESSDEEDDVSPPPVRSGKTPVAKKAAANPVARPARAVCRRRPIWSTNTDDESNAPDDNDLSDSKSNKRSVVRAAKRTKVAKSEKEPFPDEDPEVELSSWFVYRELQRLSSTLNIVLVCTSSPSSHLNLVLVRTRAEVTPHVTHT
ncbi:hypothetical protein EUX98_g9233 [Antrodiella citrinella]|uniref:Uncharacterized protein n=1 Tax=Antrodiella citrinella TaxID=2447956 RepID=A0A4S4LWE6_9APHY|nr:hypothetical protein EUX98_g9233 [Antrodiella citrinella]